jgi:subtilisin family serine protease
VINLSLGGLSLINVGAPLDPAATLIDNVSRAYGVAFAISAGNDGPGVNTVSSPGTAAGAVTVGASITPRTWDVNYDRPGVPSEGLLYFSATGPLEDGGFKPDVVAPGSALASVPAWLDWTADLFPAGRLPAGYAVYQGTSMASPQVAGAQALLLSAARQTGTPSSPHALQRALELGARRLDGGSYTYQPAEVGHGLVQVGSAWAWLRRIGTTERDVASMTGNFTLGVGSGAYQRETFNTEQDFRLATYGTAAHTYRLGS